MTTDPHTQTYTHTLIDTHTHTHTHIHTQTHTHTHIHTDTRTRTHIPDTNTRKVCHIWESFVDRSRV